MVHKKKNTVVSIGVLLIILCQGCMHVTKTVEEMAPYEGPQVVSENIETIYSDSSYTKLKLKAPVQQLLQNNNREFPKGIYVEFFETGDQPKAILTSNYAIFYKDKNLYKVSGKVVVNNIQEGKKLSTEELYWSPVAKKIYTDKLVIIETPTQRIVGKDGMDAKQDFSSYSIRGPHGTVKVD